MQKIIHRAVLWLPPLFWMALVFYLSSIPGLAVGEGAVDFWTRKPAHILEYAIFFLFLFRAIRGSFGRNWRFWELNLGAGVWTFLYALSDEIHQAMVPTREGKIEDLGFDLLGIIFGTLLSRFLLRKKPSNSDPRSR